MNDITASSRIDHAAVNDLLPVGVLWIDTSGTIRHLNRRAADMTGYTAEEAIGRSIVDFVDEADIEFLAHSLSYGEQYVGAVLGPIRIRYVRKDGSARWTECWTQVGSAALGMDGYIVTLSTESVTDNVANAVYQIASGEPLRSSLATLARAVAGYPLVASGAIVAIDELVDGAVAHPEELAPGTGGRVVGTWPFRDAAGRAEFLDDPTMPWNDTFLTTSPLDLGLDDLPATLAAAMRQSGFASVWVRPVRTRDEHVVAVFVSWREEPGGTSPNQERHLGEVVAAAGLAFDSAHHRAALERAAHRDQLTGLGNRTALALHVNAHDQAALTVLYVDLDGFKGVNDAHGHDIGDRVLTVAAHRLLDAVRTEDRVFRVGGDEFVVVAAQLDGPDAEAALAAAATRIVETLGDPIRIGNAEIAIGASVGVAARLPGEATAALIARADAALLAAKHSGKSRWVRADDRRRH